MNDRVIRIGGGGGFWGDSPLGPKQLVQSGGIDYLILDYLAEITMSLLARARAHRPERGYAPDFVSNISDLAPEIHRQGVKVVTNAGGVNPRRCQIELTKRIAAQGLDLKVAVVLGDDLLPAADAFRAQGAVEMSGGQALPDQLSSINAYLGAQPIAAALAAGADIVVTGRCVDSALALGPLVHEFGWAANDWDRLAAGSLAGHIIECGTQATGGLFTDWEQVADDWANMGFPIAECQADGRVVITKPDGTGGLVSVATVAEQVTYEIGDPGCYVLPDVVCDFRHVRLEQVGTNRVEVTGAKGRPAPSDYKVSATYQDGYRSTGIMMIVGSAARLKAERVAAAILARTRRILAELGFSDYLRVDVEVLGTESTYGALARAGAAREVLLKVAVHHPSREALNVFAGEFLPSATSMAQGITGFSGGRPTISPLVRLFSFLLPKSDVRIEVMVDGEHAVWEESAVPDGESRAESFSHVSQRANPEEAVSQPVICVPLLALAYGRSGDKGDSTNIGVIARRPDYLPAIRAALTEKVVGEYFSHLCEGDVLRYDWPGLNAVNFVLERSLGGGGTASLRHDPQGKGYAQMLLDIEIPVPLNWVAPGGALENLAADIG